MEGQLDYAREPFSVTICNGFNISAVGTNFKATNQCS